MLHWTARLLSIASIGLILLFAVGEKFNPVQFTPIELLEFLFFPVGISAGMIVAWWMEGLGGSITVGSLLMFYAINFATSGRFPRGWVWWLFTAPALLFLLNWFRTRKKRSGLN